MVKMITSEPSVELKLKKGGRVAKKMQMGGVTGAPTEPMPTRAGMMGAPATMPARGGMMGAPGPMRPSMAARRRAMRAMPSGAAPAAPVGMAGQLMKEGGDPKNGRKEEMAKVAKTTKMLKDHANKPASKAHDGLKTGGVVKGQCGYKAGGVVDAEKQGGQYRSTKMHDGAKQDMSTKKTGKVKMGEPGGYATGGVADANAGGYKKGGMPMKDGKPAFLAKKMMGGGMAYKKGGATKKAYAAGGIVDSGAPVAMPQGRKKPSAPVSSTELSGTFKKGGKVTPAEGRLRKAFAKENAASMRQARGYSNEIYSKYGKKMADGGPVFYRDEGDFERRLLEDMGAGGRDPRDYEDLIRRVRDGRGVSLIAMPEGSVTESERSVTLVPARKRGGAVC
jgi:hypothetical protein